MGQDELLMVELACLGDILEEACKTVFLRILSVDNSAYMGELDKQLMWLAQFIEFFQEI